MDRLVMCWVPSKDSIVGQLLAASHPKLKHSRRLFTVAMAFQPPPRQVCVNPRVPRAVPWTSNDAQSLPGGVTDQD